MSIILRFIISTILLIIFVIISNIYFFQYFLSKHFEVYTTEVSESRETIIKDINIDEIITDFSPEILAKYQELDKTIWRFTSYLENDVIDFVDSETSSNTWELDSNSEFINNALDSNPISIFLSSFSENIFLKDTPELQFVIGVFISWLISAKNLDLIVCW